MRMKMKEGFIHLKEMAEEIGADYYTLEKSMSPYGVKYEVYLNAPCIIVEKKSVRGVINEIRRMVDEHKQARGE